MVSLKPWDKEFSVDFERIVDPVETMLLHGIPHFRITWLNDFTDLLYHNGNQWCSYTGTSEPLLEELGKMLESKLNLG